MKKKILSLFIIISILVQFVIVSAENEGDPFNGDKEVNIVYIGGSLTEAEGWRVMLGDYIKEKYEKLVPGRTINNINAGVGGTDSLYGIMRLNKDVISYNPDMVFVEFSVNDRMRNETEVIKSVEGIVRRLQSLEKPPIINFVYTHPASMENISHVYSKIAEYYNIPEIDFTKKFNELGFYKNGMDAGINYYYNEDKVHTNIFGHTEWAEYAKSLIGDKPEKYFRHSELKTVPYNKDNYSWISANYITAKDAVTKEIIKVENVDIDGDNIKINPSGKISLNYNYKALAVLGERGAEGSVLVNKVNGQVASTVDFRAEGAMDMPVFQSVKLAENSKIELSVADDMTNSFKIKGFFINDGINAEYPVKYADDVKINKWQEEENNLEQKTDNSNCFELLKNLEFLNGCGEIKADAYVTRGEFAKILSNIFKYNNEDTAWWETEFLGSGDKASEQENDENLFQDISSEYKYYNEIKFCYNRGLLNGVENNKFLPDNNLTLIQASKVIIDLMGYKKIVEMTSTYPEGYIYISEDLRLDDDLKIGYNDNITYEDLGVLIYNALDEYMVDLTISSGNVEYEQSDKTFAEKVLGLKNVKGQMTENEYTTFASIKEDKKIVINETALYLPEYLKTANDMIGRTVEGYYREESQELKFIKLTQKDDVVVITADEEPEYRENRLYYQNGNWEKSVKIKNGAYMIYNGIAVGEYSDDEFNIKNGTITLLKTQNTAEYNIIIIDSYIDFFVSAVDYDNKMLYTAEKRIYDETRGEYIYVKKHINFEEDTIISLVDADMKVIDFSSIQNNTVVSVAENSNYYKIIYSDKKEEEFKISEVEHDEYTVIKNEKNNYEVENEYINHEKFPDFKLSSKYTLYFNAFGRVVWVNELYNNEIVSGILKSVRIDENEEVAIATLSAEDGSVKRYSLCEKIKFKNEMGEEFNLNNTDAVINQVGYYSGLIRFKINSEGEISYLELPLVEKNIESQNGQLYDYNKIFDIDENSSYIYSSVYSTIASGYEYSFIQEKMRTYVKKDNLVLFLKDESIDDSQRYFCWENDVSRLKTNITYAANLYGTDPHSGVAEYVVIESASSRSKAINNDLYIVESVTTGIYGLDEEASTIVNAKKVSGRNITDAVLVSRVNEVTNDKGMTVSKFDYCPDYPESGEYHKVEKGDIIIADFIEGESQLVNNVYLLYDSNNKKDVSQGANPGWLAGVNTVFDAESNFNNPYAITSSGTVKASEALKINTYQVRVCMGYVLAYNKGIFKYTTKDLSVMNYNNDNSYIEESIACGNGKNICITYFSNGKFSVENINEDSIKTYKTHGNDASRLLAITYRGEIYAVVLINYS